MQRDDNPEGVPQEVFDGIEAAAKGDRFAWFTDFYKNFYNLDENLGKRISEDTVRASWITAIGSAPVAAYAVVPTWIEDFRADVEAVRAAGKPTLILHGEADARSPLTNAAMLHEAISTSQLAVLPGLGHACVVEDPGTCSAQIREFVKHLS